MLNNRTHTKAFSLIELLIVITVVAIMSLVAIPSWQEIISKNHAYAYVNELMMALQLARATAIKTGKSVKFCCDTSWENGSIVVISNKVLRVVPPVFAGDKLSCNHNSGITFSPNGFTNGQQKSFYYCPKNFPKNARAVILNATGRARISKTTPDNKRIPCNF
jgi:type IV fimbrial biogenesis protein FimT